MIRLMVGREMAAVFPTLHRQARSKERLRVESLCSSVAGIVNISFSLNAGEILGLGGLMGAGRTEVAQTLFGLTPAESGKIFIDQQLTAIATPADAIEHGLAYVPEDRRSHGVVPEMSIASNTTLSLLDANFGVEADEVDVSADDGAGNAVGNVTGNELTHTRRNVASAWAGIDAAQERTLAGEFVERLRIKCASIDAEVCTLSGGNQQKVALSRWLATKPKILILDEPTQGVDVGAKSEIYQLIADLAKQGLAILLISSELPELLGLCDRIAVMRQGTISGTLHRDEATAERIMSLALPISS